MSFIFDILFEFLDCCIHQILRSRGIYPEFIFEQRCKYGISLWKSRHPDINSYIRQVLENARLLAEKNIIERIIFATYSSTGDPIDQISINFNFIGNVPAGMESNIQLLHQFEEEFRSVILKLGFIDTKMSKFPEDGTWTLIVVTADLDTDDQNLELGHNDDEEGINPSQSRKECLRAALTSQQWIVDNAQLSESLHRHKSHATTPERSPIAANNTIFPVKSFQNEFIRLEILAHKF